MRDFALLILLGVLILLALVVLSENRRTPVPVVQAGVKCVAPSSHYFWKQWRIA